MQTIVERNATPATQPPKLMDRVVESLRVHRYALSTERTYCHWIKRFILFHGKRHPSTMGAAEIEAFLTNLATAERVTASTQNQALHAVLYLYKRVLGVELPWLDGIVRARESKRLPVVLTQRETAALLRHVHGTSGTIINTAKVEVDYIRAAGGKGGTGFLGAAAAPALPDKRDDKGVVERGKGYTVRQHRLEG